MRLFLCVAATALLPFYVQATEPTKGTGSSIITLGCEACPPLKSKTKLPEYQPPDLHGQIQATTIRDVDGKKQIERAEQWLGGAPVRYVSRSATFMPPEAELMATPDTVLEKPNDGVDAGAQTSAVEPSQPFDAETLQLRN